MVRLRSAIVAAVLLCMPALAVAQVGSIAGTVRDSSGGVLPGVTVEATSPSLIEKVRSTMTDENGRYQLTGLPVGVYTATFRLDSFRTVTRTDIGLSSDFTAPVSVELAPGGVEQVITVTGQSPLVDVQNASQRMVFTGDELKDAPITRNLSSIVQLVPGVAVQSSLGVGDSTPRICSGGVGDGGSTVGSTNGGLTGCSPILTSGANAHASLNDAESLNQGRVMVDGVVVQGTAGGGRTGYITDIASAQEISFTLSGGLGETETGGTTINIVPRTGGNRYAGQFFTSATGGKMFGKNNGTHQGSFLNRLDYDVDASGSYGGPIIKDRLWFYSLVRQQSRQSLLNGAYRNVNEGKFGANFVADPARLVLQDEKYRNLNTRLTFQASQKNKFNIFFDQQFTCENPCNGTPARTVSQEAAASAVSSPVHLAQLSWNNPLTNRWLLEAVVSNYASHVNQTRNLEIDNYLDIPRIAETGATTPRGEGITSGSINPGTYFENDTIRSRVTASWITGSHNAKVGFEGNFFGMDTDNRYNNLRLSYSYATPATTCVAGPEPPATGAWCGLNLASATDPFNTGRVPVPASVTQFIPVPLKDRLWATAFYAQDQWTLKQLTVSGAVRYDGVRSWFPETCVGPDVYTKRSFCMNEGGGDGVDYQDITPRFAATWDVLGDGKNAVKFSMGKYLGGAGLTGIYTDANAARRLVNSYQRSWIDRDGDRIVDCDLMVPDIAPATNSFPNSGECGAMAGIATQNTARRFGRSPEELDESNQAIGLGTTQCGRKDSTRIPQAAIDYCNAYFAAGGESLLEGWSKRRYEWQLSIGFQRELLPRLSGEVTYNRRSVGNLTITDPIGVGCDLYNTPDNPDQCMQNLLNFGANPYYDFYQYTAPVDDRLPNGGGYVVPGFVDRKPGVAAGSTNAVTLAGDRRKDVWRGVDTNFTYRGPGGLRISGGTSTGSRYVEDCRALVQDPPTVVLREGRERLCDPYRPFQTNLRGTAAYTIPWADVLVSTAFSMRPGAGLAANVEVPISQVQWMPGSEYRATNTTGCTVGTTVNTGCLFINGFVGAGGTTVSQSVLSNDNFGERITLIDMKIAKNFRFGNKRINVGADVYNVFNSDAGVTYCSTYPQCNATTFLPAAQWSGITGMVTPRFVRFQLQADF